MKSTHGVTVIEHGSVSLHACDAVLEYGCTAVRNEPIHTCLCVLSTAKEFTHGSTDVFTDGRPVFFFRSMPTQHILLVDEVEIDPIPTHLDHTEVAVPTEALLEGANAVLTLPADYRELRIAALIVKRPKRVLAAVYSIAILTTIWVLLTPGDRFSVSEELFVANQDPDVRAFYDQGTLETAVTQLSAGYIYPVNRPATRRLSHLSAGSSIESVTLVYERRGLGSRNVLGLRQLQTIHALEKQLRQWSMQSGVCSQSALSGPSSQGCMPMDSILSYLYPYVEDEDGKRSLYFDGRMESDNGWLPSGPCTDPPFSTHDVAETLSWLSRQQRDGNVEDDAARADEEDNDGSPRYLRSTLYLNGNAMTTGLWYQLASTLYAFAAHPWSRSWYVRLYYGGSTGLMTAGLLVLLTYDIFLLLVAVVAVGIYMRIYFGQWRLALLASLQILMSFPLMLFIVCILFQQRPLSAFAGASFWVVVGVVMLPDVLRTRPCHQNPTASF